MPDPLQEWSGSARLRLGQRSERDRARETAYKGVVPWTGGSGSR